MDSKKYKSPKTLEELQRDSLILQYAALGVSQVKIRELVGVDMSRISYILKHLTKDRYDKSE